MNITTTIGIVLVGLILLGMAGSAVGSAAKDCVDSINARHTAMVSQLFGN